MNNDAVLERLRRFEGKTSWMYLDTGGTVTVGIGCALASSQAANQLSWQSGDADASNEQVARDWATVALAERGRVASAYEHLTRCRLADATVNKLVKQRVDDYAYALSTTLPGWLGYPEAAQEALLDMAYNLGMTGLLRFKTLLGLVEAGDWRGAAMACHRRGIPEDRNSAIAELFRSCETSGGLASSKAL